MVGSKADMVLEKESSTSWSTSSRRRLCSILGIAWACETSKPPPQWHTSSKAAPILTNPHLLIVSFSICPCEPFSFKPPQHFILFFYLFGGSTYLTGKGEGQKTTCKSQFSPTIVWLWEGIEIWSLGLVAIAFIHWAISQNSEISFKCLQ